MLFEIGGGELFAEASEREVRGERVGWRGGRRGWIAANVAIVASTCNVGIDVAAELLRYPVARIEVLPASHCYEGEKSVKSNA